MKLTSVVSNNKKGSFFRMRPKESIGLLLGEDGEYLIVLGQSD